MKILFVYPRFIKWLESFPDITFPESERIDGYAYPPGLGIPALMAITPERHECVFVDQNIEPVDYDTDADLIAVSYFTPQAHFAREVCRQFKARGKRVIVGGMHPSIFPEAASEFADIVCIGEAEHIWHRILEDIERGDFQKVYRQDRPTDLNAVPPPSLARSGPPDSRYTLCYDYLELSRGCDLTCGTCVVPHVSGTELRVKTPEKVVEAVDALTHPMCFIADDILFMELNRADIRNHVHEIFTELGKVDHGHGFVISTVPGFPIDDALLSVMQRGGVTSAYMTYGFDPVTDGLLTGDPKAARYRRVILDQIKTLQDHGILVYASFHLGFDKHTPAVKDNILAFCDEGNIQLAQFCLRVPWPGTRIWDELKDNGRIVERDFQLYNGAHAVFEPSLMTREALEGMFIELWQAYAPVFHKLHTIQPHMVIDYDVFTQKVMTLS